MLSRISVMTSISEVCSKSLTMAIAPAGHNLQPGMAAYLPGIGRLRGIEAEKKERAATVTRGMFSDTAAPPQIPTGLRTPPDSSLPAVCLAQSQFQALHSSGGRKAESSSRAVIISRGPPVHSARWSRHFRLIALLPCVSHGPVILCDRSSCLAALPLSVFSLILQITKITCRLHRRGRFHLVSRRPTDTPSAPVSPPSLSTHRRLRIRHDGRL